MPSPRSAFVQVAMIFMPTGYTPANSAPVRNRSASAIPGPLAASGMSVVIPAASSADPPNSQCVGSRSARLNTADTSAPATKPACTDMVSQARPPSSRLHAADSAGTTAEAENHTAIASNSAMANIPMVAHL
jgi:hypothetical protein